MGRQLPRVRACKLCPLRTALLCGFVVKENPSGCRSKQEIRQARTDLAIAAEKSEVTLTNLHTGSQRRREWPITTAAKHRVP